MPSNADDETTILPLLQERLEVGRREIVTGLTRVSTVTSSREEIVSETLLERVADIERVECRQLVDEVPQIRQEGDTIIIPIVEEVLVVEKRLFLKEEVRITAVVTERRHTESVTLREQEAVVEQIGRTTTPNT